jgi:hypothetical protein
MAISKINHAAQWAAAEDRDMGILHVMRCHRSLGTTCRIPPHTGLRQALPHTSYWHLSGPKITK